MNKRMRKKKRVGEFTQYGFELNAEFAKFVDQDVWFDVLIEAAEARGLSVGGGCDGRKSSVFVTRNGLGIPRGKGVSEEDRWGLFVDLCLRVEGDARLYGSVLTTGPLVDAWA